MVIRSSSVPVLKPVNFVPWAQLGPEFIKEWGRPNGRIEAEHIAVLGPTGSGKSNLATNIMLDRARLKESAEVIIATKPADSTLMKLGWPIIDSWPPKWDQHQTIFWPARSAKPEIRPRLQREAIRGLLNDMWKADANIVVMFDEIAYVEQELKLGPLVTNYWREGRSLGISLVATTQRPRYVSRYMWTESTWEFAFNFPDEDDREAVAKTLGDKKRFMPILAALRPFEFVLVQKRTGQAYRSKIV